MKKFFGGIIIIVMSLAQYLEMWNRISRWQAANKTKNLPNYVNVSNFKIGVDKVGKATYLDMLRRVQEYQKTHTERVGLSGSATGTKTSKVMSGGKPVVVSRSKP